MRRAGFRLSAPTKLDYNADAGLGDNRLSPSRGARQVASTRGFLGWLDELRARHRDLMIKNCASGGMRLDHGLRARTHVQSITDQEDYRRYLRNESGGRRDRSRVLRWKRQS